MARVSLAGAAHSPGFRTLALLLALASARPLWAADGRAPAAAKSEPSRGRAGADATGSAGTEQGFPLQLEVDGTSPQSTAEGSPSPTPPASSADAPGDAAPGDAAPGDAAPGDAARDPEALRLEAARAAEEAAQAEEKRKRHERIVAFARQRVREMKARKRALALAELKAEAARRAGTSPAALPPPPRRPAPPPLPSIVDHRSALERQLAAHWGWGADKDRQVRVPLPDWPNWERIRLFGIEHLAAFRYTKQHHTLTAVFAVESRAQNPSSLTCMNEFERQGFAELKRHSVSIDPIVESASHWEERPVVVHKTEGHVSFLFSRYDFSAAWTAYPAYESGCLVYATVVLWDGHPELARRVLDRFVREGVAQVRTLTDSVPQRQPGGPTPPPTEPTVTAQRR